MKILYVAKHGPRDNQDEDAIAHALRQLGHEVVCIPEDHGKSVKNETGTFLLFHGWNDIASTARMRIPRVFWYFDLVDWPDPTLTGRNTNRLSRMNNALTFTQLGFCTDGDFVKKHPEKLVWLPQGMDERVAGIDKKRQVKFPVLFTGAKQGGIGRMNHIAALQERYGHQFHIIDGKHRVHGRDLAKVFSKAGVVIAPISPVTDNYWSNRVYNTLGLGGFLLHPYALNLAKQYISDKELIFYHNIGQCFDMIDAYLADETRRDEIKQAGFNRTMAEHTYRHRCEVLIQTVKDRLL